jgi:hypothetical protein
MATGQAVSAAIDQLIAYFNGRRMDLPDGLFDRKTQFLINGATFESLLSATPGDALVMMLARGPAGYRFAAKALQHAVADAKLERDPDSGDLALRLSGSLRGSGEAINTLVGITLRLTPAGVVETAEATVDPATLEKIRIARLVVDS